MGCYSGAFDEGDDVPAGPTTFRDLRGTALTIGQTVCYNFQGTIAMGRIHAIVISHRYNRQAPRFKILMQFPYPGRESVVTSEKNLMAVFENMLEDKSKFIGI